MFDDARILDVMERLEALKRTVFSLENFTSSSVRDLDLRLRCHAEKMQQLDRSIGSIERRLQVLDTLHKHISQCEWCTWPKRMRAGEWSEDHIDDFCDMCGEKNRRAT